MYVCMYVCMYICNAKGTYRYLWMLALNIGENILVVYWTYSPTKIEASVFDDLS